MKRQPYVLRLLIICLGSFYARLRANIGKLWYDMVEQDKQCCINCKFFKSYYDEFFGDEEEPKDCGSCNIVMGHIKLETAKFRDNLTTFADFGNICKDFTKK